MNHRFLVWCVVGIACLTIMGCAKKETQSVESTIEKEGETNQFIVIENETVAQENRIGVAENDFAVEIRGVIVSLNDDMSKLVQDLGEADEFNRAKSCVGPGDDKVYVYGESAIYTNPDKEGKDIIYRIELLGTETTVAGIGIGSSVADVIAVYGEDYTDEFGDMSFQQDNKLLNIVLDGNEVVAIELYQFE